MSILTEVKAFLDAIGPGTLGTITIGKMPASPDVIGTLYEYGGLGPEGRFGVTGIGYEHCAIQLVFRGAVEDYASPRTKAETAYRALAAIQPGVLAPGATVYLRIDPVQSPFPLESPDGNLRVKIACNFYAMKELS